METIDKKPKGRDYPLSSTPIAKLNKSELYTESEKKMIQDRMAKSGKIKKSDSGFNKNLPKMSETSDLGFNKGLPKMSKTSDSGFKRNKK